MNIDTLPDRALSIRQPWAWAILNAGKRIENRPLRFHYRGSICLHASLYKPKKPDVDGLNACFNRVAEQSITDQGYPMAAHLEWAASEARGGIIGTAEIVDCIDHSDDPWWIGPYGLVLENVQPVPFIQVKGALGLFKWKNNLEGENA